jgi:hexosaminidase
LAPTIGTGPKSLSRIRDNPGLDRDLIYLEHMSKVVEYVKQVYPDKRVLIWDDMMRNMSEDALKFGANFLAQYSEPVIWNYSPEPERALNDSLWQKYSNIFQSFWIATAFKGN